MTRLATAEMRLSGLDRDVSSLRQSVDVGPDVGTLVTQLTEIVPKVIEHENRIGDLQKQMDSSPGQTAASGAVESALASFRSELSGSVDSLRSQATDTALTTMRQEMGGLVEVMRTQAQHSVQAAADLADVRNATDEERKELRKELDGLRGEVTTCQKQLATATSSLMTRLQEAIAGANGEARQMNDVATEVISKLEEVSELRARVDALRSDFLRDRDGGTRLNADLVKVLQQDEEVECEKQQKLLDRIDELCGRIAAVDSAVAMAGQNGSQATTLMDGIPAEISEQYKVLADRVEEQSRKTADLHSHLIGKFDQLDVIIHQVESLSQPRSSEESGHSPARQTFRR